MAVLVEAISVITRVDSIKARYPGGWAAFRDDVPNGTLACDDEVARVGFMVPEDAHSFVDSLEAKGLVFLRNRQAIDVAVADQQRGMTSLCDWLDFGHVKFDGHSVAACQLVGSASKQLFTPEGWQYERSLSSSFGFVPTGAEKNALDPVRGNDGIDAYRSRLTGQMAYVGRTKSKKADDK